MSTVARTRFYRVSLVSSVCVMPLIWPMIAGADKPERAAQKSNVLTHETTEAKKADWGEIRPYFTGESAGTKDVFTAAVTVEPGKAVHGAHRHAEEEYMYVIEGSGTWHLDGKEFPAKEGDLMYVEPWKFHGITNTGKKPLRFFVVKYSAKGLKTPPRPDDRADELPK
jgi:mannose-6-phosphate isomerase-like protein (cupin superfamily)